MIPYRGLFLILISLVLSGCGFHPLSLNHLAQSGPIYLDAPNPDNRLVVAIQRLLTQCHVPQIQSPQHAALILRIDPVPIDYSDYVIFDSTAASVVSYIYSVNIALLDSQKKLLATATLTASRALIKNANQVYLSRDAYRLMEQELTYNMVSLIANYLESKQIAQTLQQAK